MALIDSVHKPLFLIQIAFQQLLNGSLTIKVEAIWLPKAEIAQVSYLFFLDRFNLDLYKIHLQQRNLSISD